MASEAVNEKRQREEELKLSATFGRSPGSRGRLSPLEIKNSAGGFRNAVLRLGSWLSQMESLYSATATNCSLN